MSAPQSRRPQAPGSSEKTQAPAGSAQAGLRVPQKVDRLAALLREHQQLLTKTRQKKKELEKLSARLQTAQSEFMGRLQPVVSEIGRLDRELHELFAELLARKQQPHATLKAIRRLYKTLQERGLMSRNLAPDSAPDQEEDQEPSADAQEQDEAPPPGNRDRARPAGDGAAAQSLRRLFHRLAMAIHPDTVQPEAEKSRRTEVMKEITRAYKEGDLARLLDLERTWMADGTLSAESDDLDRRYAALVRTNAALRAQLDQIKTELKALRRSPPAELLADFERSARYSGQDPVSAAVEQASAEREHLREILDFVGLFRDGKIDLDELLQGPRSARGPAELDDDDFLDILFEQNLGPPSKSRKKGRSRGARRGNEL